MDRRRFVLTSLASAASLKSLAQSAAASVQSGAPSVQSGAAVAKLTLHPDRSGPAVPRGFIGLSYETQQLSEPSFFSPANTGLVARMKELSPRGVLRLGGNTSDYGFWKPTPGSVAPPRAQREYKVGDPNPNLSYAVTPEAVHNLRGFLDATGWSCLYGINLGTNTPALAAAEAAFVAEALGPTLEYFQVGNEADRFGTTIRDPKTWTADAFLDEWFTFAKAILARVPNARFGMPDIASNAQWFTTIGARLASDPIRGRIACLTHHYYVGGPPSNPDMTIERILRHNPVVERDAGLVREAAGRLHTAWRMTEGNTCYRGGKPGVSDVFASALWSADYCLTLASLGYAGVNLHGGDGQMVANSLGGKLPGDDLVDVTRGDDPATHPHPYYTPIAHIGDRYVAEPVSFGMRFAQQFAGATMIPTELETGGTNATVYAAKQTDGRQLIGVVNKDAGRPLTLRLPSAPASLQTTTAGSLTAREVRVAEAKPASGSVQTVAAASLALFTL